MAGIGAKTAYVAKIKTETKGQPIVYDTPRVLGEIIETIVTPTYVNNPLHAGDRSVENDNGMTGGTVSVNTDHVTQESEAYVLGYIEGEDGFIITDAATPYVGYAYVQVLKYRNVISYASVFIKKTQFALQSKTARTKENQITWQTPTLSGEFMGVEETSDGLVRFEEHSEHTTFADAEAWIMNKFGSQPAQTGEA